MHLRDNNFLPDNAFAACNFYLFFYKIKIHHFFCNAMFYLYARVHFHEIKIAMLINQKLNSTNTFIIYCRCSFNSSFSHFFDVIQAS